MLNRAVIMGRMTSDPELRQTQGGVSVLSFTVAVDRRFSDQNGERQADFIHCVAWRHTAEFISKYFIKGQMVAVDGYLQSRSYVDKSGNNRSVLELIVENVSFCGSKSENSEFSSGSSSGPSANSRSGASSENFGPGVKNGEGFSVGDFEELDTDDSELPF